MTNSSHGDNEVCGLGVVYVISKTPPPAIRSSLLAWADPRKKCTAYAIVLESLTLQPKPEIVVSILFSIILI